VAAACIALTAAMSGCGSVIVLCSLSVLRTPVKVGSVELFGCLALVPALADGAGPVVGVKVERPQRSEDERP
jgi:hypothetical protein